MLSLLYVTYDGALDPLGGSQVVPYLCGLARRGVRCTLISFEKPERLADADARRALGERLSQHGITWQASLYHHRPRVPSKLRDVLRGALRIRGVEPAPAIVQCRGDVAMLMARLARLPRHISLVYEVRGLLSDERVEVGSWRRGSVVDRAVRTVERGNLRRADGVLAVMATAGLEALLRRRAPLPPHRALPNSVDVERFTPRAPDTRADYGLVYHGSLGGWYLTREMVAFARVARHDVPGRVLFLTPQPDEARRAGATEDWAEVRTCAPAEVPAWLRRARASFFFIQPSPGKRVSSPTKFAEALATGLPVAANGAAGDLDTLLENERVGVRVDSFDDASYRAAGRRLSALLADADTPARCRRLAQTRYNLDHAVAAYHELYRELLDLTRRRAGGGKSGSQP